MRKLPLLLSLLVISLSGCCINGVEVVVPNVRKCAVKAKLAYGSNCAETNTGVTSEMDWSQTADFIEAKDGDGSHAPAIFMSADDARREMDALDSICRALRSHCTEEVKQHVRTMRALLEARK